MTDTNDTTKKPSGAKTLTLKKTETSTVKQSFSHGRTKAVVVEKKRTLGPSAKAAEKPQAAAAGTQAKSAPSAAPSAPSARNDLGPRAGVVLRQLTDEEKVARSRALADARVAEDEARRRADADARNRAVEEDRLKRERAAAEKRKAEEDARKAADEVAKRHAEEEANRRLEKKEEAAAAAPAPGAPGHLARGRRPVNEEEDEGSAKKGAKTPAKAPVARKGEDTRRRGKLTVSRALSGDDERQRSVAAFRRHLQRVNRGGQQEAPPPAGPRDITIPETITVAELANR